MKIWHFGACSNVDVVNGVNAMVWQVGAQQARLGHAVELWVESGGDNGALQFARANGMALSTMPKELLSTGSELLARIRTEPPDMVHFHSVFIPKHALIVRQLVKRRIPYVITPHGGVAPRALGRGRLKKGLYSTFVEKRLFRRAFAITAVMPREVDEIRRFCAGVRAVATIPNPLDLQMMQAVTWRGINHPHRITYLGRFDVFAKGLDRIAEIARRLPNVEFSLYGDASSRDEKDFGAWRKRLPANVRVEGPVYGADKMRVLRRSDMYLQLSRWEVFGMSAAEAMCLGVPCAVSREAHISQIFARHNLGLVVSDDAGIAAGQLEKALNRPEVLQTWSLNSSRYAKTQFHPRDVAERFLALYEQAGLPKSYDAGPQRPGPDKLAVRDVTGEAV